jgi:hypothetical protein
MKDGSALGKLGPVETLLRSKTLHLVISTAALRIGEIRISLSPTGIPNQSLRTRSVFACMAIPQYQTPND